MKDSNCGYCMGGDILAGFGIKICDLQVSQLREQRTFCFLLNVRADVPIGPYIKSCIYPKISSQRCSSSGSAKSTAGSSMR